MVRLFTNVNFINREMSGKLLEKKYHFHYLLITIIKSKKKMFLHCTRVLRRSINLSLRSVRELLELSEKYREIITELRYKLFVTSLLVLFASMLALFLKSVFIQAGTEQTCVTLLFRWLNGLCQNTSGINQYNTQFLDLHSMPVKYQ